MKKNPREGAVEGGRLGRLGRMARLGADTATSLLLSKTGEGAAARAAEVLGNMRGLAAKLGQMASYVDGIVPEEHRAAYEASLRGLQSAAFRSPPAAARALVEEELGAPLDQLFLEWTDEPFASASIGQVHRARLRAGAGVDAADEGLEVAVKVQHPGIDRAVESDLKNAGLLEGLAGTVVGRHFQTKRMFDEVRARFREELDYRLEAERQREFHAFHGRDPGVRIPRIIDGRSARRVMTSELCAGLRLEEAVALPEADRRRFAEILWRFVYRGSLVGGIMNADPHPGNYLFQPGGAVTFLDFGCVERFGPERREIAKALHRAAGRRDEEGFRLGARRLLETRPGRWEDIAIGHARRSFDPIFASPFRMTAGYVASIVAAVKDQGKEVLRLKQGEFSAPPPGLVFVNRLQFGFYSVLARLDVEVDYAEVERGFLEEGPPGGGG